MKQFELIRLSLMLGLLGGCGASGAESSKNAASGGSAGAPGGTGGMVSGDRAGAGPAAGGGVTAAGGASSGAGGSEGGTGGALASGGAWASGGASDAGGAASCPMKNAWDVTYNLDGSTFEVRDTPLGAGDQLNTCTPPYTANDQIGPGTMTLRFPDSDGAPGPGRARLMQYDMDLDFTVAGATSLRSALAQNSVAGACGAAAGAYDGSVIHWDDPGPNLRTVGNLTCSGALCALAGYADGTPFPTDNTSAQALLDFTFSNGVRSFSMPEVLVLKDPTSSEWLTFKGTETSRKAVCDCR